MAKLLFALVLTSLISPPGTVAAQQFMDHKNGWHQEPHGSQIDNGFMLGMGQRTLGLFDRMPMAPVSMPMRLAGRFSGNRKDYCRRGPIRRYE